MSDKAEQAKAPARPLVRTDARVAGGALVVSVLAGDTPKVWRAEMPRLSAAAFELKEEGSGASVVLRTAAGVETVHAYPGRAEAVAALQAITQALFAQQGGPGQPQTAPRASGGLWGKFFKTIFYILTILVCAIILFVFMGSRWGGPALTPPPHAETPADGGGKMGVPLPADKMFGK